MEREKCKLQMGLKFLVVLALVAVVAGCGGSQCKTIFRENMTRSVTAVEAGQLDKAQQYINSAKDCAKSYEQRRQLDSMEELVNGAQAMMDGQVADAKASLSRIRDPQLNHEVRRKAQSVLGVDVSMIPQRKEIK
jgi:hypothetical protein